MPLSVESSDGQGGDRMIFRMLVLVVALALASAQGAVPECQPRGGLPNTFQKLAQGERVRIAYLGGSITAQPGWRPQSLGWFRELFPAATVEEINAAIGGTGSDLGVFRLRHDVLDAKPDLIFVEFAVNDAGAPPAQIYRCMEGIVRQTWRALPSTDLCFVYTLAGTMLETLKAEQLPASQAAMEKIASHYGIPSINFGVEVARLEGAGRLVFRGKQPGSETELQALGSRILFSPDGVHPYPDTGHALYLQSLVRAMAFIRPEGKAGPHTLGDPFVADHLEAAKMFPLDRARLGPGWVRLDGKTNSLARSFGGRLPGLWRANQPGDLLEFQFRGTYAGVYDLVGPDCGQVSVSIDEGPAQVRPRFDGYCTYHRLATLVAAQGLTNATHRVRITIHPDQPDKVRILAGNQEKMDDPARFDGRAWYAGAILLVGELVEVDGVKH